MSSLVQIPEVLYPYRLFCSGATFSVLCEHKTIDELWADIRSGNDEIPFWNPKKSGGYANIRVKSSLIIGVDNPFGSEPVQTTRDQQRQNDKDRRRKIRNPAPSPMTQPIPRQSPR